MQIRKTHALKICSPTLQLTTREIVFAASDLVHQNFASPLELNTCVMIILFANTYHAKITSHIVCWKSIGIVLNMVHCYKSSEHFSECH